MQKIEKTSNEFHEQYCFQCGEKNVDLNAKITSCKHLVFIGTSEGPEYDSLELMKENKKDKSCFEIIEELDNKYIGFCQFGHPPNGMESYIVYKDLSK